MNPCGRVMNRMAGKAVDRIPNMNILITFSAKYIGVSYDIFVTDYRKLLKGTCAAARILKSICSQLFLTR